MKFMHSTKHNHTEHSDRPKAERKLKRSNWFRRHAVPIIEVVLLSLTCSILAPNIAMCENREKNKEQSTKYPFPLKKITELLLDYTNPENRKEGNKLLDELLKDPARAKCYSREEWKRLSRGHWKIHMNMFLDSLTLETTIKIMNEMFRRIENGRLTPIERQMLMESDSTGMRMWPDDGKKRYKEMNYYTPGTMKELFIFPVFLGLLE